jgi:hypothetical protein
MAKDSRSEIDPRFDAAFQRGFDPSIPIDEYVPPRQPRRAAAPAASPVAVAPVAVTAPAVPVAPEAPRAESPVTSVTRTDQTATETESVASEPITSDPAESNSVRNPFLLFLGIIAVALIATGVWLFVRSGEAFNSKQVRSQGDYMSLTATIDTAPFIALLGAATAIGVLFVFAARWKRRR